MSKFVDRREAGADRVGINAGSARNADDCGMRFRANPPDVEIRDTRVPGCLDQLPHFVGNMMVGRIKQVSSTTQRVRRAFSSCDAARKL